MTATKVCESYQNLSKEEKSKKQKYNCERYKILSEDEMKKLIEYSKKKSYTTGKKHFV